ncbi:Rsp5p-dependent ubiquitination, sorting of cargo proteins at the multivesicular body [Gonapodya sp. JEL0774]|nr:Rsp5p-dependent ubiquitination, sorting of cargo proteins at the multivesicular body [Gonapodya sp. JEL0774]
MSPFRTPSALPTLLASESSPPSPPPNHPWIPSHPHPAPPPPADDLLAALIPVFLVALSVLLLLVFFLVGLFCSGPNAPRGSAASPKREDEWFAAFGGAMGWQSVRDRVERSRRERRARRRGKGVVHQGDGSGDGNELEYARDSGRGRDASRFGGADVDAIVIPDADIDQEDDNEDAAATEIQKALARAYKFVPNLDMGEERGVVYDVYDPFDDISSWGGVSVHEGTSITFRKWTERTVVTSLPLWKPTAPAPPSHAPTLPPTAPAEPPYLYFEALLSYVGPDQEWLAQNRAIQQVAAVEERIREAEREVQAVREAREREARGQGEEGVVAHVASAVGAAAGAGSGSGTQSGTASGMGPTSLSGSGQTGGQAIPASAATTSSWADAMIPRSWRRASPSPTPATRPGASEAGRDGEEGRRLSPTGGGRARTPTPTPPTHPPPPAVSVMTETPSGTIALVEGVGVGAWGDDARIGTQEHAVSVSRNRVPSAAPPPYEYEDSDEGDWERASRGGVDGGGGAQDTSILVEPGVMSSSSQQRTTPAVQQPSVVYSSPFSWFRMLGGGEEAPNIPPVDQSVEVGNGEAANLFQWDVGQEGAESAAPQWETQQQVERGRQLSVNNAAPFRQPSPGGSPRRRDYVEHEDVLSGSALPVRRAAGYTPSVMTLERLMPSRGDPDIRVSVGLCTRPYPPFYLPGRYVHSIAYVTDHDGAWVTVCTTDLVGDQKKTKVYELGNDPRVMARQGDTVGVGYSREMGTVFFTVNGVRLELPKEAKPVEPVEDRVKTVDEVGRGRRVKGKGKGKGKNKIKLDGEVASGTDLQREGIAGGAGKNSWWTYLTQMVWRKPRRGNLEVGGAMEDDEDLEEGGHLDVEDDDGREEYGETSPLLGSSEREGSAKSDNVQQQTPVVKEPEPDFFANPDDPDDLFWAVRNAYFNFHACVGATGPCQVLVNFGRTPYIWEGVSDHESGAGESWMTGQRDEDDFGDYQTSSVVVEEGLRRYPDNHPTLDSLATSGATQSVALIVEAADPGEGPSDQPPPRIVQPAATSPPVYPDSRQSSSRLLPPLRDQPSFSGSLDSSLAASSLGASTSSITSRSRSPFRGGKRRTQAMSHSSIIPSDPVDAALAGAPLISEEARMVLAGISLDVNASAIEAGRGSETSAVATPNSRWHPDPSNSADSDPHSLPPSYETAMRSRQLLTVTPSTPMREVDSFQLEDPASARNGGGSSGQSSSWFGEPSSPASRRRSWDISNVFHRASPSLTSESMVNRRATPDFLHPRGGDEPPSPSSENGSTPRSSHRRGNSLGELIAGLRRQSHSDPVDVELQ